MTRAHLDKRPDEVAAMFDSLAERYDLVNDLLSLGQDRLWRRGAARAVGARGGDLVLDLAAGTGTSTVAFAKDGADCVACDFSLGMLQVGVRHYRDRKTSGTPGGLGGREASSPQASAAGGLGGREASSPQVMPSAGGLGGREASSPQASAAGLSGHGRLSFVAGDALRLPFRDESFDAVTISFGLRNVADTGAALAELRRVTRSGGRLVICEFSRIPLRPLDALYERYLTRVLPAIARKAARNPDAYLYLAESIGSWPPQRELARRIQAAGWSAVRWRNLSFGVVALHSARRLE